MGKRRSSSDAEVPLSAMIDVTFLLLIYFIVTQKPIIEEAYLGIDLPGPPANKPPEKPPQLFTIDVAKFEDSPADFNIYGCFGRRWQFDELKKTLISTGQNNPDTTIVINCDPNAKHEKLIRLLDACAEAGLTKLNLINDESVRFSPNK